jgi:hypothetical protein
MSIKQEAHMSLGIRISVADLGMVQKHLRSIKDTANNSIRCRRIILSYEFVNIPGPTLGFFCPGY